MKHWGAYHLCQCLILASCAVALGLDSSQGEESFTLEIDLRSALMNPSMPGDQRDALLLGVLLDRNPPPLKWNRCISESVYEPAAPHLRLAAAARENQRLQEVEVAANAAANTDANVADLDKQIQELNATIQQIEPKIRGYGLGKPARGEFEPKEDYKERLRLYEFRQQPMAHFQEDYYAANRTLGTLERQRQEAHRKAKLSHILGAKRAPKEIVRLLFPITLSRYDMDAGMFLVGCCSEAATAGSLGPRQARGFLERLADAPANLGEWIQLPSEGTPRLSFVLEGSLKKAATAVFAAKGFRDADEAKAFKKAALAGEITYALELSRCPYARRIVGIGRPRFASDPTGGSVHTLDWRLTLIPPDSKADGEASALLLSSPAMAQFSHIRYEKQVAAANP